ncbi:MAG: hypothetical protein Q8K82_06745 [Gemmatimonadaceae bacterium]|nr:hypothetical protein [Gemmatimonadaceae bacterium]
MELAPSWLSVLFFAAELLTRDKARPRGIQFVELSGWCPFIFARLQQ